MPPRHPSPLERTFLHLPGVGAQTEHRLWSQGIRTWSDLEKEHPHQLSLFGKARRHSWIEIIQASREALSRRDAEFFAARLPAREHYRIAATFPAETVFLDIETTGLSLYYDRITLIGVARGERYTCDVLPDDDRPRSVRSETWRGFLKDAKCLVTFNGTQFDLKFLQQYDPGLALPRAHVDLRFFARRVALAGGQKAIEGQLGITRPEGIGDVDGRGAVLLWYEYKAGDLEAGRRLVRYNHADVEGMKPILDAVVQRLVEGSVHTPVPDGTRFSASPSSIRFQGEPSRADAASQVRVPRPRGRKGPAIHHDDLRATLPEGSLRVVGIDLTGSARRATGWCLMEGSRAETRLIGTDDEILEEIQAARPHLVSIDSPLSLPQGRIRVGDDDPGRAHYGILRRCERTLKQRGINVYPCLIPSMQGLTARGIRIAERVRSLGIPVIESYPGAAQDIMNIPRKRASLDQLKEGLRLFGVTGNFLSGKATHDEVDAVTSAVVGLFFWSGKFEALGNEAEDYLIIPNLRGEATYAVDGRSRRVVGISGAICAGKTTAGRQLEGRGFVYGRYSQVLAELVGNDCVSRTSLQAMGRRIHRESRQRWLNQQLLHRLQSRDGDYVIDGLRWPEDHAFWAERFGPSYCHVHLHAPPALRRQRYVAARGTAADFDRFSSDEVESGVASLKSLAHHVLRNDQTPARLEQRVSEFVAGCIKELPICP